MNHHLKPRSFLMLLTFAGVSLVLGGCSKNQGVVITQSEKSACAGLQNVITQASSGFSSLKQGAGVSDYDHTRWDTKSIFKDADCDVVRWGTGKVNFACTWSSKSQEEAKRDFAYGLSVAKSCLDSNWTESSIPGVTGEGTRFSAPGNPTVVDVRVAKELAPSQAWHTSLTVGAPINRDAK